MEIAAVSAAEIVPYSAVTKRNIGIGTESVPAKEEKMTEGTGSVTASGKRKPAVNVAPGVPI